MAAVSSRQIRHARLHVTGARPEAQDTDPRQEPPRHDGTRQHHAVPKVYTLHQELGSSVLLC